MREKIRQKKLREERLAVTPWPVCTKDCSAAKAVPNLNCAFLCGRKFDGEGRAKTREMLEASR